MREFIKVEDQDISRLKKRLSYIRKGEICKKRGV